MLREQWLSRVATIKEEIKKFPDGKTLDLEKLVEEEETDDVLTWEQFQNWFEPFKQVGCFRGQSNATWCLHSKFDRAVHRTFRSSDGIMRQSGPLNADPNEQALLAEFKRGAKHYHSVIPKAHQTIDWLALMQHYGAPTRLLDWTRSPYVALYFALREESDEDAVLWAIDLEWLAKRSIALLRHYDQNFAERAHDEYVTRSILKTKNPNIIVSANPTELNERMIAQQGHLLCNLGSWRSFSWPLFNMLVKPDPPEWQTVSRVKVKRQRRIEFLKELRRMNIHHAALFPGLDGFAKSLEMKLKLSLSDQEEEWRKRDSADDAEFERLRHELLGEGVGRGSGLDG